MKTRAGIAVFLLELVLLADGLRAMDPAGETKIARPQSTAESTVVRQPKTRVQDQLTRLIQEEAGIASPASPTEGDKPEGTAEGTLELEPMIVDGKREMAWPPPLRENKVQEVLRTGTLWERVDSRFTKRFWAKGDRGIGFTLSW